MRRTHARTGEPLEGGSFQPLARRQPDIDLGQAGFGRGRGDHRSDQQIVTEQVFEPRGVRAVLGRCHPGQRSNRRNAGLGRNPGGRVEIRNQLVALVKGGSSHVQNFVAERPRAPVRGRILIGVQSQDRGVRAELHPPHVQFRIVRTDVAADVVAPPAVADVGPGRGVARLELQSSPARIGVTGEPDRIAVAAQPTPAAEPDRSFVRTWPARCSGLDPGNRAQAAVRSPTATATASASSQQQRRQFAAGAEPVAAGDPAGRLDRVAKRAQFVDVAADRTGTEPQAGRPVRRRSTRGVPGAVRAARASARMSEPWPRG